MSIFSKKTTQRKEPEDLDSGYENPYYSVREDRHEDRRETRRDDYDRREDRRDDYDRRQEDYYDNRRPTERAPRDEYYEDDRRDRRPVGGYEEEDARGYRERVYEEEQSRRRPERAPEKPAAPENKGTLYFTPESYRDVRVEIVTGVSESHVVVVNISELAGSDELVRLLDYLMGAVQVLGATLRRWNGNNLLLIPKDVEIDEKDLVLPDEDEDEDYDEEYEEEEYDDEEYDDEEYEDYDEE